HIFRQDAVLNETDHAVLRILVKFPWHVPDFPIYSNGTKPGALHWGGTSVAMVLGAYLLFTLAELPLIFTVLIVSLGLLTLWAGIFGARLNARTSR
ncbi:hypothetical protein ACL1FN_13515, partial [Corynebacterium striatum]